MDSRSVSDARRSLMACLLPHKREGRTLDELARELGTSRTAVQQHVTALERDGLVERRGQRRTAGRPSRRYGLTEVGYEMFPRRYDLLAETMLTTLAGTVGEEALDDLLARMADDLAERMRGDLEGLGDDDRIRAVAEVMDSLGYEAAPLADGSGIAASNCIYHRLARRTRAVCRFDVRLLSHLVDGPITHTHCMVDGDDGCVFRTGSPVEEERPTAPTRRSG